MSINPQHRLSAQGLARCSNSEVRLSQRLIVETNFSLRSRFLAQGETLSGARKLVPTMKLLGSPFATTNWHKYPFLVIYAPAAVGE